MKLKVKYNGVILEINLGHNYLFLKDEVTYKADFKPAFERVLKLVKENPKDVTQSEIPSYISSMKLNEIFKVDIEKEMSIIEVFDLLFSFNSFSTNHTIIDLFKLLYKRSVTTPFIIDQLIPVFEKIINNMDSYESSFNPFNFVIDDEFIKITTKILKTNGKDIIPKLNPIINEINKKIIQSPTSIVTTVTYIHFCYHLGEEYFLTYMRELSKENSMFYKKLDKLIEILMSGHITTLDTGLHYLYHQDILDIFGILELYLTKCIPNEDLYFEGFVMFTEGVFSTLLGYPNHSFHELKELLDNEIKVKYPRAYDFIKEKLRQQLVKGKTKPKFMMNILKSEFYSGTEKVREYRYVSVFFILLLDILQEIQDKDVFKWVTDKLTEYLPEKILSDLFKYEPFIKLMEERGRKRKLKNLQIKLLETSV